MPRSRQIARIVGPTLIALGISEAINLDALAGNAAPVVYLNGTLLFVAGLAIVQAHNRWSRDWRILVTLTGWILLFGGLYRMIAPQAPQVSKGFAADAIFIVLIAVGGFLTFNAYRPERPRSKAS
jgi:hypothetical protein